MRRLRAGAILSLLPQLGFWGAAKLLTTRPRGLPTMPVIPKGGMHARYLADGQRLRLRSVAAIDCGQQIAGS